MPTPPRTVSDLQNTENGVRGALAPLIALTCGEPGGIGLDLVPAVYRGLCNNTPYADPSPLNTAAHPVTPRFFVIGDPAHLPAGVPYDIITSPAEAHHVWPRAIPVLSHPFPAPRRPGHASPENAGAVIEVISRAVGLVQAGEADAITTLPINKAALKSGAGFAYPGHTEFLAALAGQEDVVMMLACSALRVVPVTIHIALKDVATTLTPDLLERCIRMTDAGLRRDFGLRCPRIAVAGLNPHAGEGGAMGDDEIAWIAPLLDKLRLSGFDIAGPLPPDTMFHAAARARYDVAICMYHDQALIPIKTIDFAGGVNVTLGLPFIRTSPDHGTAFDIAGSDQGDPTSTLEAIKMAAQMVVARRRAQG